VGQWGYFEIRANNRVHILDSNVLRDHAGRCAGAFGAKG
jgi:hypothetical protein